MDVEITPEGAEAGSDVTEAASDLDSVLEAAWNTEAESGEDTDADEAVDTDAEDDEFEDTDNDVEVEEDDTDDSETQRFTVKVDGEEVEVTLEEALAGYQRQSDYTRKTQLLAQDREKYAAFDALNEALQADPAGTLSKLSRLYGVELGDTPAQDTAPDPLEDLPPELAAEIREMRGLRQEWQAEKEQREQQSRTAQIDAEIEAVRVASGDESLATVEGQAELLSFAVENGIPSLELAYELKSARAAKAVAKTTSSKKKVVERKRTAPPVEGGRNRSNGAVKGSSNRMSLEDAFEAALAEHS